MAAIMPPTRPQFTVERSVTMSSAAGDGKKTKTGEGSSLGVGDGRDAGDDEVDGFGDVDDVVED